MEKNKTEIPELIGGLLRKGEKMLFTGPRFAGKSQLLIQLAVAFATGTDWIGFPCEKSRAFYVNLDMDKASCLNRINAVFEKMGLSVSDDSGLSILHLRGRTQPKEAVLPSVMRMAKGLRSDVIILDPIDAFFPNELITETEIEEFRRLMGQFCEGTEAAVICCAEDPDLYRVMDADCFLTIHLGEDMSEEGSTLRILKGETKGSSFGPLDLRFDWPVHTVDSGKEA